MRIHPKGKKQNQKSVGGFSLVEAMVAAAVMGLIITSLMTTFSQTFTITEMARQNLRATQILTEKMEVIRLLRWDQLGTIPTNFTAYYDYKSTNNTGGLVYYGKIIFSDPPMSTSYTNDLRLVSVEIQWDTGHGDRTEKISSLVARSGIQRYVFEN